jgi:hypothetical protein
VQNEGGVPHSFTAVDGSFDTGLLAPGESAEIPLGADGIVRAFRTLHGTAQGAGMAGVLVVGEPSASGAPPYQAAAVGTFGLALGGGIAAAAFWRRGRATAPVNPASETQPR